jgi:hypothetical protein
MPTASARDMPASDLPAPPANGRIETPAAAADMPDPARTWLTARGVDIDDDTRAQAGMIAWLALTRAVEAAEKMSAAIADARPPEDPRITGYLELGRHYLSIAALCAERTLYAPPHGEAGRRR